VLGIFGFLGVTLVLSVVFGILALTQSKGAKTGGRGLAVTGLVISALWAVGFAVLIVLGITSPDRTISATAVKVGDCFTDVPTSSRVASLNKVSCDQPHRGEVYAVLTMPDGPYPGQTAMDEYKYKCEPELATYSPMAVTNPAIGTYVLYPSPETWDKGDRAVACIATVETRRTGSIKG
jgi:Septum formation